MAVRKLDDAVVNHDIAGKDAAAETAQASRYHIAGRFDIPRYCKRVAQVRCYADAQPPAHKPHTGRKCAGASRPEEHG